MALANRIGADPWVNMPHAADDAWMQVYGMRAAQMAAIWREAFTDAPGRLSVVAGVPTGWPGLEQPMLAAPLAMAGGQIDTAPVEHFDAYAVTGYFGHELGTEEMEAPVERWIAASRSVARARAAETGEEPEAYLARHGFDLAFDLAAEALRRGSLGALLAESLPYHAQMAARHGLDLVLYEGGTHVVGHGAVTNNDTLTTYF